ncbi:hypothetical protein SETIT_4G219100v2 [Setaria italica]|uniref:MADS-box domain-containing protein n=1 Tax=Setaria italica TaxID=4555 RepID=A0A368QWT1_SETIT|nr:hypothetical protein SETIT_4G219100v2 [Setaria italica]
MAQSQTSFSERTNTLFFMAKDLSQEFGAHIAVVAFSPTGEPKAYGTPTTDSILRTYLPEILSSLSLACSETAGEVATRVDGMKWEAEEIIFLAKVKRAYLGSSDERRKTEFVGGGCGSSRTDELPVFLRALEVLRTDIQCHLDATESFQKEKMQP